MDGPTGTLAHGRGTTGTYGRGSPPTARAIDVARSTASGLVSVLASNNCRRTSAAAVSAFATTKAATHHRLLRAKTVHTSRAVLLVLMVEAHVDACARQHAPSPTTTYHQPTHLRLRQHQCTIRLGGSERNFGAGPVHFFVVLPHRVKGAYLGAKHKHTANHTHTHTHS